MSMIVAAVAWLIGYGYLVKIAGFSAAGFFTFKMVIGIFLISLAMCLIFQLRGFFERP